MSLPWFPFYVDDFLASPKVRRMDAEQVGIYLLLLIEQWQTGEAIPEGSEEELAPIMRTQSERITGVLQMCFERTAGGWVNLRLRRIMRDQQEKSVKARRAAKARWEKASDGDADAMRTHSERNAGPQGGDGEPKDDAGSDANALRTHSERNAIQNQNQNQNQRDSLRSSTAAAVGDFLDRTSSDWRLKTPIADWCDEIEREPKYAGADIEYEIRKCADWHVGKGKSPGHPDMSIRNWLEKAGRDAQKRAGENGARKTPDGWTRV